jgi:hypothetical protein
MAKEVSSGSAIFTRYRWPALHAPQTHQRLKLIQVSSRVRHLGSHRRCSVGRLLCGGHIPPGERLNLSDGLADMRDPACLLTITGGDLADKLSSLRDLGRNFLERRLRVPHQFNAPGHITQGASQK